MRKRVLLGIGLTAMAASLGVMAVQDQGIPDEDLGLFQASVTDNPAPPVVTYDAGRPGTNKLLATSYGTAPPMIPHSITGKVPITRESNKCMDCHDQPDRIGQKLKKGMAVPIPASHYVDVKKGELDMHRWNCTQCHQPQADVKDLVSNTFQEAKPR
jgi:nitrate reductase (cytochrome), electron transfer subunit